MLYRRLVWVRWVLDGDDIPMCPEVLAEDRVVWLANFAPL